MTAIVLSPLEEQERIVERGLSSFVEVGNALMRIRDGELYREAGFDGFVEYLESKPWGIGQAYARYQIDAARVATMVATTTLNERQARELAPLMRKAAPEVVKQVYAEVVDETEGRPTASAIRAKVRVLLPPREAPAPKRALTVDLRPQGLLDTAAAVEDLVRALVLIRSNGAHPGQIASTIEKLEWVVEEILETLRVLRERSK